MKKKGNQTHIEISDWSKVYNDQVNARSNKEGARNKWYPILEGFSAEFVNNIIHEQPEKPSFCLDPFAGGGTTPLVCGKNGIPCASFEVSPFMSQVCRAKLRIYESSEFIDLVNMVENQLKEPIYHSFKMSQKTIVKNDKLKKWLFHDEAYNALLNIRHVIDVVCPDSYKDLFYTILSSILLKFSNVIRDGKALKYRKNWEVTFCQKEEIYRNFIEICKDRVLPDLLSSLTPSPSVINNLKNFKTGDSRILVDKLKNDSVDLVITSPPYLNSRDYTDSHMIELWMLGHIVSYDQLREHRRQTLRSHVQVSWGSYVMPNSIILENSMKNILVHEKEFWNKNIPSMIAGYFCDIELLLSKLKEKIKKNGKLYINVANSSYYEVVIESDRIIAEIAGNLGYKIEEIRLARKIKTSSQQAEKIGWLRESVVVLKKN